MRNLGVVGENCVNVGHFLAHDSFFIYFLFFLSIFLYLLTELANQLETLTGTVTRNIEMS